MKNPDMHTLEFASSASNWNAETSSIFHPGQSVIIVGNGPSALKGKRGQEIDNFDLIVRFNRFTLKGYEEQVGSRTDVWCCNEGPQAGTPEIAIESGARALLFASNHDRPKLHQAVIARWAGLFPQHDIISRQVWSFVRAEMCGIEPSSGMLAITHALQFIKQVYTIGFDCMEANKHHYFEAGKGSAHPPEAERGFYAPLLRSGVVLELPLLSKIAGLPMRRETWPR